MQIFRQKNAKKSTIFHTLKNRAKIEKKMQENYEKLYISFGNVVQMVLPIIYSLRYPKAYHLSLKKYYNELLQKKILTNQNI